MTGSTLLVDPLAAFFRPELTGRAPLVLDTTHVEVTLLPPLAQVVVVRRFTNTSDQRIEAVLTLPPLRTQEVVFRLTVSIGGAQYDAVPQAARQARSAHDGAVGEGRRAILHELLKHDISVISIAGIAAGDEVEVQIWSVRPLERPDDSSARLFVPLSARHDAIMSVLGDADALATTAERHTATLTVHAAAMQVSLIGQGDPYPITSRDPIRVDCAAPIQLEIVPEDDGTLDHCAWQVDRAGGWEATSSRGIETFRHPMNPEGTVVSDRSDWIFGVIATADGDIRVTAPLPTEGIAPNARAMRAFAAAGLREAAIPQQPDAVRREANILSRAASLAFVGSMGEASQEFPMMRKLALPEMIAEDMTGLPPQPIGLEPFDYGPVATPTEPALPVKIDQQVTPGARNAPDTKALARHVWPGVLAAIALLVLWSGFRVVDTALPPRLFALLVIIMLAALAVLPEDRGLLRRRLPMLVVFVVPWIAALLVGPLLDDFTYGGAPPPGWMIPTQLALLASSAILPLAVLPFMRGAQRFALALGMLNLALTAFVAVSGILVLTPD